MVDFLLSRIEQFFSEMVKLSKKDKKIIYDQISFALNQTKAYIEVSRVDNKDKSSAIISNIWQRTSKNIQKINNSKINRLAKTIEEKSKYWASTETYDKSQFDTYNMRISQVEESLKKIFK